MCEIKVEPGQIYGFTGVIGSGKSYRMKQVVETCNKKGIPVICVDFSEGIRKFFLDITLGHTVEVDCNSVIYSDWKKFFSDVALPIKGTFPSGYFERVSISGRTWLQRIGEKAKIYFGEDVWAKYTHRSVIKQLNSLPYEDISNCVIVFGSIRFLCEARIVFLLSSFAGKPAHIYFTNYQSQNYSIMEHESEKLAQEFLPYCDDMQNITNLMKRKLEENGY